LTFLLGIFLFLQTFALQGCSGLDRPFLLTGGQQQGQTRSVQLQVIEQGGSVLALVPVYIDGQGPYAFALDTGASRSLIDQELADQMGLQVVGRADDVTGVTGTTEADIVRVDQWRAGDVQLPTSTAIVLDLPGSSRQSGLRGLLGSDVLSSFGAITVDYEEGVLILRSRR